MATIYQISNKRYITVRRIPGSPTFLVRECYREPEAPSGWYEKDGDHCYPASTPQEAAQHYLDNLRAG